MPATISSSVTSFISCLKTNALVLFIRMIPLNLAASAPTATATKPSDTSCTTNLYFSFIISCSFPCHSALFTDSSAHAGRKPDRTAIVWEIVWDTAVP